MKSYIAFCERGVQASGRDVQSAIRALTSARIYAQRPFDDGDNIAVFLDDAEDFGWDNALLIATVNVSLKFERREPIGEDDEIGERTGEIVCEL